MWIEEMRSLLRKQLPDRAFLKRDRGEALFVTNAPVFDPEIREIPGFILTRNGNLLHILPDASWLARAEQAAPPDHLSASLLRFREEPVSRESLLLFARGCKLLEEENLPAAEIEAYDRSLRQRAAMALRGEPGGGIYACAILNHQLQNR